MHPTTLVVFLSVALSVVLYLFRIPKIRRNGIPLRQPPNTLPLIGNGLLFLQARHRLFSWFALCEQKFGFETFQIFVPSLPPGVVINDPKNLEFVFRNEGIFAKGDFFKRRSWDLFGNGIINADGDLWKVQRKAGLHFLNNANLKVLTDIALPQYLSESIQVLENTDEGETIDLEEHFHELTTQLMGRMAYNVDIHNSDPFSRAFDYASGATSSRFQNPLWFITELFFGRQFRDSVAKVKAFGTMLVQNAVHARLAKSEDISLFSGTSGILINSLLDSIDDHQMVADAALNYLSAGRDTTAQALTWTFYLLMRNPTAFTSARLEATHALSLNPQTSNPPNLSTPNTSSFKPALLPYITSIFHESLRLYPPVPLELKQCSSPTTLPDGTLLPKYSILVWCTWAMNRSSLIWGPSAHSFQPERWLDGKGNFVSRSAFEFPVFNGGPRTCLGKKMAEMVAVQTIAAMVLKFDFEATEEGEKVSKNSLTLPMEGGLPCRVKMRK